MFTFGHDLVGLIVLLLALWAIVGTLQSPADGATKLIWVLIILILPLAGFVLWYLFGPGTKRPSSRGI